MHTVRKVPIDSDMCNNYENDIDLIMRSDGVADPEGMLTANRAAVPTFDRGSSFWLPTALLFTVLWLVINTLPEFSSRVPSVVSRIVIHPVILGGLWLGLERTAFDHARRLRVWLAVAIPYAAWAAAPWCATEPGVRSPLPLAIFFLPVIIGLPLLLRSRRMPSVLDATPPGRPELLPASRPVDQTVVPPRANKRTGRQ
jgi:hypothetical protein